jgi:hypothetical protein
MAAILNAIDTLLQSNSAALTGLSLNAADSKELFVLLGQLRNIVNSTTNLPVIRNDAIVENNVVAPEPSLSSGDIEQITYSVVGLLGMICVACLVGSGKLNKDTLESEALKKLWINIVITVLVLITNGVSRCFERRDRIFYFVCLPCIVAGIGLSLSSCCFIEFQPYGTSVTTFFMATPLASRAFPLAFRKCFKAVSRAIRACHELRPYNPQLGADTGNPQLPIGQANTQPDTGNLHSNNPPRPAAEATASSVSAAALQPAPQALLASQTGGPNYYHLSGGGWALTPLSVPLGWPPLPPAPLQTRTGFFYDVPGGGIARAPLFIPVPIPDRSWVWVPYYPHISNG